MPGDPLHTDPLREGAAVHSDSVGKVTLAQASEASYEVASTLGLALQPGHGLLQVLHHEVHLGPGGAAAHAEPKRVPGHVKGDATAQQHRGWPAGAREQH